MELPIVAVPSLEITGARERFPVRRIYCVGQNYADHAREMGADPSRQPPFFFSKPPSALVPSGTTIPYPPRTGDLHHEVEMVMALGRGGADIPTSKAIDTVFGYAVGVDLTRRDLQAAAKASGRPWDLAKGFDHSAPIGPLTLGPPPSEGALSLTINDQVRQQGDLSWMIWSTEEIISELSKFVTLAAGDLIFTGTPSGVGALLQGDRVIGNVFGAAVLSFAIDR